MWRIVLIVALIIAAGNPLSVAAQNVCIGANAMCADPESVGRPCVCAVPAVPAPIPGVCTAVNTCTYTPTSAFFSSITQALSDAGSAVSSVWSGLGTFGQYGVMMGGSLLVQTLMSGGGGGGTGGGGSGGYGSDFTTSSGNSSSLPNSFYSTGSQTPAPAGPIGSTAFVEWFQRNDPGVVPICETIGTC